MLADLTKLPLMGDTPPDLDGISSSVEIATPPQTVLSDSQSSDDFASGINEQL